MPTSLSRRPPAAPPPARRPHAQPLRPAVRKARRPATATAPPRQAPARRAAPPRARARPRARRPRPATTPRRHAQTQHAEEVEGHRPLPRDREVRRPAGANHEATPGARSPAENLREHADRRTAPEQEQHAAGVHGRACCARARKPCSRSPERRSCTGAPPACRAPRSARRSACAPGQSETLESDRTPAAARSPTN